MLKVRYFSERKLLFNFCFCQPSVCCTRFNSYVYNADGKIFVCFHRNGDIGQENLRLKSHRSFHRPQMVNNKMATGERFHTENQRICSFVDRGSLNSCIEREKFIRSEIQSTGMLLLFKQFLRSKGTTVPYNPCGKFYYTSMIDTKYESCT